MTPPATVHAYLLDRLRRDPSSPLVTDLDLASGERVELSVASAANGVAKAAHLVGALADALGRPPRIALRLPLHWQAVTFALGAWAAGASVLTGTDVGGAANADAVVLGPAEAVDLPKDLPETVWGTRLHPFGLPFDPPPAFPVEDLTPALRAQADDPPPDRGEPTDVAVVVEDLPTTQAQLLERATALAAGLPPGGRLLSRLPLTTTDGWVTAAVLPLLRDCSVLLVRGSTTDLTGVCAAERVAATAGLDVPGLLRVA